MMLRILIVDDERGVASTLQSYLEDESMEVESAGSAEEALKLVRSDRTFDLCIMDIRLPGMNGDSAIQNLHRLHRGMKYLIHTGSAGYELSGELRSIGVESHHIFRKPVPDLALLAAAVRSLCAGG